MSDVEEVVLHLVVSVDLGSALVDAGEVQLLLLWNLVAASMSMMLFAVRSLVFFGLQIWK